MHQKTAGFTLLEVLISISIFAISISIVYGLYSSTMAVVTNVEELTALNIRVQTAFLRISRDLSGLYRGEQGYLKGLDSIDPAEDEPILQFISTAHLSFNPESPPVPLSVIRYYLIADEQDETFSLLRSDTPMNIEIDEDTFREARKFTLCKGLLEVRVRYMDREGDDKSEWDTSEGDDEEQRDDGRFPGWIDIDFIFPAGDAAADDAAFYSTAVLLPSALIQLTEGGGG